MSEIIQNGGMEDLQEKKRRIIRAKEAPIVKKPFERPDILGRLLKSKEKGRQRYPVRSNWASMMGSACLRELWHNRVNWKLRELPPPEKIFLFEAGDRIETSVIRDLEDAGFSVAEQQARFEIQPENISGKIDARLIWEAQSYPMEIKGLVSHTWEKLNTFEDFFNHPSPWVRKYPAQLLLYMFAWDSEWGLFLIVNKTTYLPKIIWLNLYDHLEYVESILKRATLVNDLVKNPELFSDCPNNGFCEEQSVCTWCSYYAPCQPPEKYQGAIVTDEDIIEALDMRLVYEEGHKNYNRADKKVKDFIKGRDEENKAFIAGNWQITGKMIPTKGREAVPAGAYWKSKIAPLPKST
ncbi:MAG: hypothetical protein GY847_01495 [Proteobacteria bacterium]|nr:hypothetical protein [Pseudomonadota bacterium]